MVSRSRAVLYLDRFEPSRSLGKTIRRRIYTTSFDQAFEKVIQACASSRKYTQETGAGTWITDEMQEAYIRLHKSGYAHSVETWDQGELVGGLYGVALGRGFFGESMFHKKTDASKVALAALVKLLREYEFDFIDCQLSSPHILSLGAQEIPRGQFLSELKTAISYPIEPGRWGI